MRSFMIAVSILLVATTPALAQPIITEPRDSVVALWQYLIQPSYQTGSAKTEDARMFYEYLVASDSQALVTEEQFVRYFQGHGLRDLFYGMMMGNARFSYVVTSVTRTEQDGVQWARVTLRVQTYATANPRDIMYYVKQEQVCGSKACADLWRLLLPDDMVTAMRHLSTSPSPSPAPSSAPVPNDSGK